MYRALGWAPMIHMKCDEEDLYLLMNWSVLSHGGSLTARTPISL